MPATLANTVEYFEERRISGHELGRFANNWTHVDSDSEAGWKKQFKKSRLTEKNIDLSKTTPKVMFTDKYYERLKGGIQKHTKQKLFKEICSFKSLNNNWDGYGAIPLEIESAANAIYLISSLSNYIFESIDKIFPNPHGTISIMWGNSNNETVSLEIGNNDMSYYADISGQETEFFDNIAINDSEIAKLSSFIFRII
jgi:hypothetical protein